MSSKISVDTVVTVKNVLTKNAGSACLGAVKGLTRNSTIKSEVVERRAEREMPKSNEFMRKWILSYFFLVRYSAFPQIR